jgi:leucyl/phenylalanyl-tRNA--protein transferase
MTNREKAQQLDPDFVVMAYCNGYFPMADPQTYAVSWYSPNPRAIIPLDNFKVPRSLKQRIRKRVFEIRIDTSFEEVIRRCSERDETWISEDIIRVYSVLHKRGLAHSVESWRGDALAGGLYGVAINGAFFGESMFSKQSDASKIALVHLVDYLNTRRFRLLDTQYINEHISQFGAVEISRSSYLSLLSEALHTETQFRDRPDDCPEDI